MKNFQYNDFFYFYTKGFFLSWIKHILYSQLKTMLPIFPYRVTATITTYV